MSDSEFRKFKVIVTRTVTYKMPTISFTYPYKPGSVVQSKRSKLLIRGKGARRLTRGVGCLVRGRRVEGRVKGGTHVGMRHFTRSMVVRR